MQYLGIAISMCVAAAYAQQPEPEPMAFSVPVPEPEPMMGSTTTTMGGTTSVMDTTSTTAPPTIVHTVASAVSVANISAITSDSHFMQNVKQSIESANPGATVTVEILYTVVKALYKGFPDGFDKNDAITAYAAMINEANKSLIRCNNVSYSSGRRLAEDAVFETTVQQGGTDVITKTQNVIAANNASNLMTQLQSINSTAYASVALDLDATPSAAVQVKTVITTTNATSDVSNSISSSIASGVPGGATVSSSVLTVVDATTTTVGATTATTTTAATMNSTMMASTSVTAANEFDSDDAFIAPVMTFWFLVYNLMF